MVLFRIEELGVLDTYAKKLPEEGPYNSVQLGELKELDVMVSSLEKSSGIQVHLTMLLRKRAMAALPDDTAALLRVRNESMYSSNDSSEQGFPCLGTIIKSPIAWVIVALFLRRDRFTLV